MRCSCFFLLLFLLMKESQDSSGSRWNNRSSNARSYLQLDGTSRSLFDVRYAQVRFPLLTFFNQKKSNAPSAHTKTLPRSRTKSIISNLSTISCCGTLPMNQTVLLTLSTPPLKLPISSLHWTVVVMVGYLGTTLSRSFSIVKTTFSSKYRSKDILLIKN